MIKAKRELLQRVVDSGLEAEVTEREALMSKVLADVAKLETDLQAEQTLVIVFFSVPNLTRLHTRVHAIQPRRRNTSEHRTSEVANRHGGAVDTMIIAKLRCSQDSCI